MRILTLAAHPDDETLGAGATMARFAAEGHEVRVLVMTDGVMARHGETERQQLCAIKACEVLGVSDVTFCGLRDQQLDAVPLLDVIRPIEKMMGEFEPEIVFTHFKEDANQDHRVMFQAALVAARPSEDSSVRRLLCYETASSTEWAGPFAGSVFAPSVFVDVSSTLARKLDAMRCYADTFSNELKPFPHPRSLEAIEAQARMNGVAAGLHAAEVFMDVRHVLRERDPDALVGMAGM